MDILRSSLRRLLQIKPGEGLTFSLLALSAFLVVGGNLVIGRTVSRSLFLSNLPPEYIPYRYLAMTAGIVIVSVIYARYAAGVRRDLLVMATTTATAVGILIFRVLLVTSMADSLLLLGGLFVYLEAVASLTLVQFWTYASDVLNSREAKRLFNPIAAMGSLGGILAGGVVSVAAVSIGTANLLLVLFAAQMGFVACAFALGRHHLDVLQVSARQEHRKREQPSLSAGLREIGSTPLLLSIALITVVTTLVSNIVEYQFDLSLQGNFFGNEQAMSAFLGSFYFWAGLVGFALQLFISGRLLSTFGLTLTLLVLPLSLVLGSALTLVTGAALWAVTVTRSTDVIYRSSTNLLDLPLPRDVRARGRAMINGIVKPISIGAAGLLFLVVGSLSSISLLPWSFLVIALSGGWALLVLRAHRQYQQSLSASILRRQFDPAEDSLNIHDETTVEILRAALRERDEAQLLQGLSLLHQAPQVDWSDSLLPLLQHPAETVRIESLRLLGHPRYAAHAEVVEEQVATATGAVRATAVTALCAMQGAAAAPTIAPLLEDADPAVRSAAVVAIIRHTGLDGILQGALALKGMLDDRDPAMRAAAADTLGELQVMSFFQPLLQLMADEVDEVRSRALMAAGRLGHPDLLPGIIERLGSPATLAAAMYAMLTVGPASCAALATAFAAEDFPRAARSLIPRVLGRIESTEAVDILLQHLDERDEHTRARVYKALVRQQARGATIEVANGVLDRRLDEELRLAYEGRLVRFDLDRAIDGTPLADVLALRQNYALDRIFYLLGLLYPGTNMGAVRASVSANDANRRANATELLDATLSRGRKERLLPLLEGPDDRTIGVATQEFRVQRRPAPERAYELAAASDNWLAACALYAIAVNNWPRLAELVEQRLQADDDLLRETATAIRCLFLQENREKLLQAVAAQNSYPVSCSYARRWLADDREPHQGVRMMPLSTIERVLFLRGADLFRDISGEDLVHVARLCQEESFSAGGYMIRQGDIGDCLYIIVDGTVSARVEGVGEVNRLGPKDVVGEMAIISRNPRSAHCVAETDVAALRIDFDDFWDLLAEQPPLALGVIRVLSARLDQRIQDIRGTVSAEPTTKPAAGITPRAGTGAIAPA